jgi:magnesium chelatase family protein
LPAFTLVGLPTPKSRRRATACAPRSRTAASSFPQRRITVNLAPADLPKESGRFDLPIALGILIASGRLKAPTLDQHEFAGELALSGELRAVRGTLAMCAAMQGDAANGTARAFVLPAESAPEAALIGACSVLPAATCCRSAPTLPAAKALAPFAVPPAPTPPPTRPAPRSRARPRPSARWKSPPPAVTACC